MSLNPSFWKDKTVLVTGHTGFVGSWMTLCLLNLGAKVIGFAKAPHTNPNLYSIFSLEKHLESYIEDITHFQKLSKIVESSKPDIILHLAAQALVRASYQNALETYQTNVMGTAHILECFRESKNAKVLINVTTDKCYENKEENIAYAEEDRLGGYDPYSNSKACSELITSAYRNSFFNLKFIKEHGKACATARAGNIIGGGDFSEDRLIPDFIRTLSQKKVLKIRNPFAIRPWQHVLEPILGYLLLAENLWEDPKKFSGAWNFGPEESDCKTVEYIASKLCALWPKGAFWEKCTLKHPHEAKLLKLDTSKAKSQLKWRPQMNLDEALEATVNWYYAYTKKEDLLQYSLNEISSYLLKLEGAAFK